MKKLIVLLTLVVFIGVNVAPVYALSGSGKISLVQKDDDPKKNKDKKEDKECKETSTSKTTTTKTSECPHQKECKQECPKTTKPTCEDDKKTEEKK